MNIVDSILDHATHPMGLRVIDSVFFIVEFLALFYLLSGVFPRKGGVGKSFAAACLAVGWLAQTGAAALTRNNFTVYFLLISLVCLLFSVSRSGSWLLKGAWCLLSATIVVLAETVVIDIAVFTFDLLGRSTAPLFVSAVYFSLIKLGSKGLLLLVGKAVRRMTVPADFALPASFQLSYFILALMMYIILYLMSVFGILANPDSPPFLLLVISTALLSIVLITYRLYTSLAVEYGKNLNASLMRQRMSYQRKHYEDVSALYSDMRGLRRDLLNHISCMDELLTGGQYDALKQYFAELKSGTTAYEHWIESGNPITNAVINRKYQEALAAGVEMNIQAAIPPELSDAIRETDLCAVLSNLLDNAIEASRKVSAARVDLVIKPVKNYLSITVSNSTAGNILAENPQLTTTKTDSTYKHGLGIHIIKSIVQKYDGMEHISVADDRFTFNAMLKIS